MIRWIDEINGIDSDRLYEEVKSIRRRIKRIKQEDNSPENAQTLRGLYDRLNDLLLLKEYLLIVVDKEKEYLRACEGFMFNGRHYKRLVSTTNGVKTSTIIFASDYGTNGALMREELKRRMDNGRDESKLFVPAKLEAYRALVCSASTPVSNPSGVLVVPDVIPKFKSDYIYICDNPSGEGEPLYEEVKDGDCENNATDGYGLISPALMERWSHELGYDYMLSGCCVRAPFTKGMVFPIDFHEFARKVGVDVVQDIWGTFHRIEDIDLILTESMLKLTGSYQSWDQYWQNTVSNHAGFSVTKAAENNLRESRQANYQFTNPLDCSDDDVKEFIRPTVEDLAGVCGGDIAKLIIYLTGESFTSSAVARMEDDWIKALMIDKRVADDPYVRRKVTSLLRRRFARAKLGRLRIRGDFQIVGCDPYILMQSVFKQTPTGLLRSGEIYSEYWITRNVGEVVLMRAPMTIKNNLCKRRVSYCPEARYWYKDMKSVIMLNAFDLTAASLNG